MSEIKATNERLMHYLKDALLDGRLERLPIIIGNLSIVDNFYGNISEYTNREFTIQNLQVQKFP